MCSDVLCLLRSSMLPIHFVELHATHWILSANNPVDHINSKKKMKIPSMKNTNLYLYLLEFGLNIFTWEISSSLFKVIKVYFKTQKFGEISHLVIIYIRCIYIHIIYKIKWFYFFIMMNLHNLGNGTDVL